MVHQTQFGTLTTTCFDIVAHKNTVIVIQSQVKVYFSQHTTSHSESNNKCLVRVLKKGNLHFLRSMFPGNIGLETS